VDHKVHLAFKGNIYNKMSRLKKYTPEEAAERKRLAVKKWHKNNKDKVKTYIDEWKNDNLDYYKCYYQNNLDSYNQDKYYYNQWRKDRRQNDPLYALTTNVRSSISKCFDQENFIKESKTIDILGCSFEQFKQYIESQFEPWMNWDNRGGKVVVGPNMTWDLDHIIPISSATTEDDVIRLNHYTNFQPLCSYHNRFVKRDKY